MSHKAIPEEIEQFILEKIDSVAEMEALLLLRSNPAILWSRESLAKRLYIAERTDRLDSGIIFARKGF